MPDLAFVKDILQVITSIFTILGFPIIIASFIISKRREERDREWGTYNTLAEDDTRFMTLCLNNPDLDILEWLPVKDATDPKAVKNRKEMILFAIELNEMERAFLLYRNQDSRLKKAQWEGWREDFWDHVQDAGFRTRWKEVDWQLDTGFMSLINELVEKYEREVAFGKNLSDSVTPSEAKRLLT